jgi:hypothetical protein
MRRWWHPLQRKPGTAPATDRRPLSEVARHVIAPDGITASEWPSVRLTCHRLGWSFDGWQDGAGMLILAQNAAGEYAADTIVISIPRQVGKTFLIGAILFALCLMKPGLRVIWTAQVKDTALETFEQFLTMSQRPKVKAHIDKTPQGKGDEAILFRNGSRIEFGARDSGFGRGRTDVDVIVFDEGQHLSTEALENMGAAQNVAQNPLTFVMGTPPRPRDKGEFFRLLREEALDGDSEGTLYIETSADRGSDPMDRAQWTKANPSFPRRTSERAMLRLRKKLKNPDSWAREALGIWDEAKGKTPFPAWPDRTTDVAPAADLAPSALGVDMSHDRVIAISGCWVDPTEPDDSHLELLSVDVSGDTAAAIEWIVKRAGRRIPVVVDGQSPAASMVPTLKARRVKVHVTGPADMGKACGGLHDAVRDGHVWHVDATEGNGQQALDDAMAAVVKRNIGTAGAWGLDRSDPDQNIAPAVSAVLAHFGGAMTKRKSTGPGRRVVVS